MRSPPCSSWRWAGESFTPCAHRGGDRSPWAVQPLWPAKRARKPRPGSIQGRDPCGGRRLRQRQVGVAAQHHWFAPTERRAGAGVWAELAELVGARAVDGGATLRRAVPEGRAVFLADGHRKRRLAA